jgi:hypothetical protein
VPPPAVRASRDDGYEVDVNAAVSGYTVDSQLVGIVSDDQRVRTTAPGLGATVMGTVGVAVRVVKDGLDQREAYDLIQRIDSGGLEMTGSLRETAVGSLMRLLARRNTRSPSAVVSRIKQKASRFSAVANRNAICWHIRSRHLLGTGMNPITPPQPTARKHG